MFKKIVISILSAGLTGLSVPALAQTADSENSMKLDDTQPHKRNKVPGEDVDEEITNAKMRAESGSKSRWSVASTLGYDAGSLEKPLDDIRPNIAGATGTTDFSDLNGQINVKYNLTPKDSILVGGGVRWISPFSGNQKPTGYDGKKVDIFDPSVNYQRIYKVGDIQSYFQVGPTFFTRSDVTRLGFVGNFGIYNVNAYEIGHSGVTIGLETLAGYSWFRQAQTLGSPGEDGYVTADQMRNAQADLQLIAYPYLEYKFNDTFNFRTVSELINYEHRLSHTIDTWKRNVVLQSVGIGISVTRDVFLYPNVQVIPDRLRPKDTNLGLQANINLF